MGDRYSWQESCIGCGNSLSVYYAPSCGVETIRCDKCGAEYSIGMHFVLTPCKEIDRDKYEFGEKFQGKGQRGKGRRRERK